MLVHIHIDAALNAGNSRLNLLSGHIHLIKVIAKELDGNRGACAGKHVVDTVTEWLSDDASNARHGSHLLSDVLSNLFSRAIRGGFIEVYVDFAGVGGLRMLVQFAASGASAGAFHLLHLTYLFFQKIAETISFGERSARLGNGSDGQSALIEGRQEAAAECAERYDGDDESRSGGAEHNLRMSKRISERAGVCFHPFRRTVRVCFIVDGIAVFCIFAHVFIMRKHLLGYEHLTAEERSHRHSDDE